MKILLLGSGGREHAFAKNLAKSRPQSRCIRINVIEFGFCCVRSAEPGFGTVYIPVNFKKHTFFMLVADLLDIDDKLWQHKNRVCKKKREKF